LGSLKPAFFLSRFGLPLQCSPACPSLLHQQPAKSSAFGLLVQTRLCGL